MLAEFAGVSRVAVYAAMNPEKKTTVSLSGKTREKILSAAKELGYVPNDMGRTLVSGRSRNVGLLLQSHDSRMSRRLIFACGQRFGRAGYMLIPDTSQNSVEREREILSSFLIKRVDCVIVGWLAYEKNCDLLEQFDRCGIPMIHLQSHSSEYARSATIAFDEAAVMELLCDFLIRRGKKRIGYAGFRPVQFSFRRPFRVSAESREEASGTDIGASVLCSLRDGLPESRRIAEDAFIAPGCTDLLQ